MSFKILLYWASYAKSLIFERERERERETGWGEGGRGAGRDGDRGSEAGSVLSAHFRA